MFSNIEWARSSIWPELSLPAIPPYLSFLLPTNTLSTNRTNPSLAHAGHNGQRLDRAPV